MNRQGTYALLLRLDKPQKIMVGALGLLDLSPGWFLYIGSAYGPGGLASRLARHRRRANKRFHWHIDYVRAATTLVELWTHEGRERQECFWAAAAATLAGAAVVAPGFGASDCRCPSHFYHYPLRPQPKAFARLTQTTIDRERVFDR
jgi:Uri superfamily endonuclease